MALGFLAFLYVLFFLGFGFDFDLYWSETAVESIEDPERLLRLGLVIGLPLAGAIFTSFQAVVLRNSSVDLRLWILPKLSDSYGEQQMGGAIRGAG